MARLPISRAALSSRLTMLCEAGVLTRNPPDAKRAAYLLTEAGEALGPTFGAMSEWSGTHLFKKGEEPRNWSGMD